MKQKPLSSESDPSATLNVCTVYITTETKKCETAVEWRRTNCKQTHERARARTHARNQTAKYDLSAKSRFFLELLGSPNSKSTPASKLSHYI